MIPRKRHNRPSLLLDVYACFLIPAYTLLFAGGTQWFQTNFSLRAVLGNDHYRGFVLWGLLSGAYFLVLLTRLAGSLPGVWLRIAVQLTIFAACGSLMYSLAIPYLPDRFPAYAALHTLLAFSACVFLMLALLLLLLAFRREASGGYGRLLLGWLGIVLLCAILFFLAGIISTALEVFFTLSTVLLTRRLWLHRRREGRI